MFFHAQNHSNSIFLDITQVTVGTYLIGLGTSSTAYPLSIEIDHIRNNTVLSTNTLSTTWVTGGNGDYKTQTFTLSNPFNNFDITLDTIKCTFRTTNPFTERKFCVYIDYNDNVNWNMLEQVYNANTVDTFSESLTTSISTTNYNHNKTCKLIGISLYSGQPI